jgi:PAS domain S-box-containing protein
LRHLAAIVQWSDDAIVTKDLDGRITSWNRGAARLFGYTAAEVIGKSIRIIIPADRQDEEDRVIAHIRAGNTVDHYETVRQRKDGSLFTISLTVSPLRDGAGRVIGASKIARDISDSVRLRADAERRAETMQKLQQVGETLTATLDRDRVVETVTDLATHLVGAQVGVFFYNPDVEDSRPGYLVRAVPGAPRTGRKTVLEPRAAETVAATFRASGPIRIGDVTADAHVAPDRPAFGLQPDDPHIRSYLSVPVAGGTGRGRIAGGLFFGHASVGVFTEESEQLAVGIAAWTALALENASLYVEARDANRSKDEFLAVLSHELRTPLSAIVGYARLLRAGLITGEKAGRGVEAIDKNASLLSQIVEDLLDVSRITAGKVRLDVQPVELPVVVHNALATVRPAADAKGVKLHAVIDPHVGPVAGDRDRLQQVIWNLLSNAVKFTPRGGRVQVRLERVNSHIEIVVVDSGLGIKPEFLPRVFERFSQADAGTTRKTGGLGLGLAIARHLVELHGGTIAASSDGEQRGATFRVRLPLMSVQPATADVSRQHPRTDRMEPLHRLGDLRGVRVVAVDDEEESLGLVRTVLEAAGAEVIGFTSPGRLLDRVAELHGDVLLLDIGMPGMDGFEVIRRIRTSADASVRRLPAAALTAFARAEDRTRALESGFEMHLAKPVDPGELVASVITLVRRAKM